MPNLVSNAFTLLPPLRPFPIKVPISVIASGLAVIWLASGHPKLNYGRMLPSDPAALLITAYRTRRWR